MMKKIILGAFVLLLAINVSAQEINWVTFEEAVALQKKNPKKIMMDVYTNWCGPCKMLDRNTFKNKDVVKYVNDNYYAVKFNAEGNKEVTYKENVFKNPSYDPAKANRRNSSHEFARFLQVRAYPTIAFFDEELQLIAPITGYQKPQQLELYLKLFKDDKYKTMTSQEAFNEYYKAFKPTFGQEGK
ncbi:thioredoxin fold domain-containing protein [uncultured Winogradskyella sp.]|uniref:thioredoxin family protein n=1 Tax=uncultured Winogradskyella sp. TaxID=395353 RepID=UPI0026152D54|nr:thioredoxin fold domain-containing protein [uncultured Winogradskyella sp.]